MLLLRSNIYWENNSLEFQVEHVENGFVDFTVFLLQNDFYVFWIEK